MDLYSHYSFGEVINFYGNHYITRHLCLLRNVSAVYHLKKKKKNMLKRKWEFLKCDIVLKTTGYSKTAPSRVLWGPAFVGRKKTRGRGVSILNMVRT